ncbi:hypothetical protein SPBR_02065 [Sporothrix brasiliensis 5110]|uniref:Uncharacterized protein n=1 Tax=Sporothrix brasiliensis 5110 TaxID=1398154 RepID=A0A0C2IYB1_9PEZI|nr:uncharacterized protein SPBR_02065 [Sporothrix brasiliensis 5110]KIH91670.1 hypothetical protein SPBR_02065 [Sporothrix brasiliensis 5110]
MSSFKHFFSHGQLAARSDEGSGNEHTITAMIILLAIVFSGLLLTSTLVMLRRVKRRQQMLAMGLPQYNDKTGAGNNNPHGLTIQTTNANGRKSVLVFGRDGQPMLANPQSPPYSPDNVPEIRITFPDEHDETGRRKSGRVVVVRVGEHNTVGMEPLSEQEEQLPAYEKDSKSRFYSIDMDQIGGLKEKQYRDYN